MPKLHKLRRVFTNSDYLKTSENLVLNYETEPYPQIVLTGSWNERTPAT